MTLDEAIKHEEEVMVENLKKIKGRNASDPIAIICGEYADNHRQLAEWLKDYKRLLEQESRWIPVSEESPKDLEPVNITWVNHNPESYYADIKDKPFTATGVYFNGQWYWWSTLCTDILAEYSHNYDDVIDDNIEIIAWQPLPNPTESK